MNKDEPSFEQCYTLFDTSKVYERMLRYELDTREIADRIGMSFPMTLVTLKLGICPNDKIDILASTLLIDKGELII